MKDQKQDEMAMRGGHGELVSFTAPLAAYDPEAHMFSVSVPDIGGSTFAFRDPEEGEHAFGCAYGLPEVLMRTDPENRRRMAEIYARLSGPTVRVAEAKMTALEPGADWSMLFPAGMSAIHALAQSSVRPRTEGITSRDVILHSRLLYGGTHALMHGYLPYHGIKTVEVDFRNPEDLRAALRAHKGRVGLTFMETPANPTLEMLDISAAAKILAEIPEADRPIFAVDNTFMGVFQQPLLHGADVVMYSSTKYLGGHADLISGFLVGKKDRILPCPSLVGKTHDLPIYNALLLCRTLTGLTPSSAMAQRLSTHMDTYRLRMERQAEVATAVAGFLAEHPKVANVRFPAYFTGAEQEIYKRQCLGPSGMIAFTLIPDTKSAAFAFLRAVKRPKHILLAVSLGAVRTLIENPSCLTHSDIAPEEQSRLGITPGLIRLSVGIEDPKDLIRDLGQSLDEI